jgi:hypothetical protein
LLMELLNEGKNLIAAPDFMFDTGEVWLQKRTEVCDVACGVRSPEGIFSCDYYIRRVARLSKCRQS